MKHQRAGLQRFSAVGAAPCAALQEAGRPAADREEGLQLRLAAELLDGFERGDEQRQVAPRCGAAQLATAQGVEGRQQPREEALPCASEGDVRPRRLLKTLNPGAHPPSERNVSPRRLRAPFDSDA